MAGLQGRGRSARLSAAVVLKQGREVEAPLIKAWVNERVSVRYQRVSEVVIMKEFPRNAAGKTLKRSLRDAYWQDAKI
jgi:acyl-coenzyme A synthetase/AMP-(fatty) acid ligase